LELVLLADIIDKLSHQIHPDEPVVDEEEAKWRRYKFHSDMLITLVVILIRRIRCWNYRPDSIIGQS